MGRRPTGLSFQCSSEKASAALLLGQLHPVRRVGQFRRQEITDLPLSPSSGMKCFPQFRLIFTNPLYGFHARWALLALWAVEAGNDLAGRSWRRSAKRNAHVQADSLHVCSIHFARGSFAERQRDGQFEVAPDHFDSTSKTETVRVRQRRARQNTKCWQALRQIAATLRERRGRVSAQRRMYMPQQRRLTRKQPQL